MATANPYEILASLRKNRGVVLSQIRHVLDHAVATGQDARLAARAVGAYFSPWYAMRRGADGQMLRTSRAVGAWPARPGMASQYARALMENETSQAQHDGAISRALRADEPTGLRWRTSLLHDKPDLCDQHARRDVGFGRGVTLPDNAPARPHFRCVCYLETVSLVRR